MKLKPSHRSIEGISTASMADIAFLLIIFFMVTTVLSVKKGLELKLPEQDEEVTLEEKKVILINIEPQGLLTVDQKSVQLSEIKSYLKPKLTLNPGKFVIIKAHDDVHYENLIDVLDELKQARVKNIVIPTKEEIMKWDMTNRE
ncbi:ExbD/TolR family protein [candidate division CSSED10-310 bacterium]|uniref:ExbD/TolR family protein n=1 Tax=candidate division CSSED10-310 bacterium TaxID=2855610 RepID=A0ABV6YR24_UNCC1